jgi:transcription initiation factor IIF auxiliary subunit
MRSSTTGAFGTLEQGWGQFRSELELELEFIKNRQNWNWNWNLTFLLPPELELEFELIILGSGIDQFRCKFHQFNFTYI